MPSPVLYILSCCQCSIFTYKRVSFIRVLYVNKNPVRLIFHHFFQNHTSQTTPEKDFSQSIHSLHISSIYEHTETKSSEYICKEDERSEGSEPPEYPTSTAYIFKNQNWAVMIDRGARLVFPLSYSAFTIAYFVVVI